MKQSTHFCLKTLGLCCGLSLSLISTTQAENTAKPSATAAKKTQKQAKKTVKITEKGLPSLWLNCKPITNLEKDHLYLFEFWATWCGPCIAQMPHLEELHQHFKEDKKITLLGINVWDDTPEKKLEEFINKQNVSYPMAADGSESGKVAKQWLKPLGVRGIPHAIAVRNHKIIWRGHPSNLNKELIKQMKSPSFSLAAIEKKEKQEQAKKQKQRAQFFALLTELKKEEDLNKALAKMQAYAEKKELPLIYRYHTYKRSYSSYYAKGKQKEAQQILAALQQQFPEETKVQFLVATSLLASDDLKEKNFELIEKGLNICIDKAKKANKPYELYLMHLADAKLQQGDKKAALKLSQQALEQNKNFRKVQQLKAKITP